MSLDTVTLSLAGAVGGFILLHSTQVQPKNTTSVIVANLLSIAVGTILFWATGYAFAYGPNDKSNFFLSYKPFFLIDATDAEHLNFCYELVYLMLVLVIGNSGFISRMRFWIYPLVSVFIAGFIYPCARHWTNHAEGWLIDGIDIDIDGTKHNIKYMDAGGAVSIHVFAGSVALIGTIMLAPRKDRNGKKFKPVGGNLTPLMLTGYFLAFIGMLSKSSITSNSSRVLTNNLLAAQGGAFISFGLKRTGLFGDRSSTKALINGSLAGLVAVTGFPSEYHAYGAFVVGVVGAIAYCVWSALLQLCHVDDPTDSAAVHLGSGLWAAMAGPIFRKDTGILYDGSKVNFQTFGWHVLAGVAIFVWSGLCVFIVLIIFVCTRIAKYSGRDAAEIGLDALEHKEPAYPDRDQYTPDNSEQVLDDLFGKDSGLYGYDNRASRNSGQQPNTMEYRNEHEYKSHSKY